MELLQLQYFFDSSKNENFAKTAEKYMVPPSSVSSSVKRLEAELGCKLFDRSANRIMLNENGRILQSHLCNVFEELGQAKSRFLTLKNPKVEFRILVRTIRNSFAQAVIRYRTLHPEVTFQLISESSDAELETYDLIIDEKKEPPLDWKRQKLCSQKVLFVVSRRHPLRGREIPLLQLRHQDFITMGESNSHHKLLQTVCKSAGFTPKIVLETNDLSCYKKCIAENAGIGLLSFREDQSPDPQIDILHVTDFSETQNAYIYYRQNETNEPLNSFVDFLNH